MEKLKIGIIGAGAIGGILASHLVNGGQRVSVCDIDKKHLDICQREGLEISGLRQLKIKLPVCHTDIANLKDEKPDILFIAVKSSTLEFLVEPIKNIFHENMLLICYQNGLAVEDFLADHFPKDNIARVVVNFAGSLTAPGKVQMTFFTGSNYLGGLTEKNRDQWEEIAALCTRADLETVYTRDIKIYEWEKVILNCSLSPVSALTGLTMKGVMEDPVTRGIVKYTLAECIQVAKAEGIEFFQDDFFDFCLGYLDKAGHHKPSMLLDVENRRRTEIGFLNRKVAEYGKRLGVDTPCNTMLAGLVYGIDKGNHLEKNN